jgi:DNA-binding NarL/FixJ family response regulator
MGFSPHGRDVAAGTYCFNDYQGAPFVTRMKPKRITVLVADDNQLARRDIREVLEREKDLEVVGEAGNGREAVALAKKLRPALVLMDVAMPLLNGLQATRQILKAVPGTKVLMLSIHEDRVYVEEATRSGAMGYLVKHTAVNNLCRAIRQVHKGKAFFKPPPPSHLHRLNLKEKKRPPSP